MQNIKLLIEKCRKSESSVILVIFRHFCYKVLGKNVLVNEKVIIRGIKNIYSDSLLQIGMDYCGFMHKYDKTFLNINGRLIVKGKYSIGRGCRFDIGRGAEAKFGRGYVNANTNFIIMHGITVGDDCAISWGCEFLDEDFHDISYKNKKLKKPSIKIGDHVWIGSNVTVLKGSKIPDGCVIASGSVVCSVFEIKNCLLAGNPAKVVKENIEWK